jgi:hypothetical protein
MVEATKLAISGINSPVDITSHVQAMRAQAANTAFIRPAMLQRIMQSLVEDQRGISGLSFSIDGNAVTTKELPRFLALRKFNAQQIGNILYGIYRGLKQTGELTIGEDNLIRVKPEQLSEMAKNGPLSATLASVAHKMEESRNFDPLYATPQKPAAAPTGTPPAVPYNQPEALSSIDFVTQAETPVETPKHNELALPGYLLGSVLLGYGLQKEAAVQAAKILFTTEAHAT